MKESAFREARKKIKRANEHINDFNAQGEKFFGSDEGAHTVAIKTDPETNNNFVEIVAVQSLPDRFALILGDALHNLRSALDFAWYEIAEYDSPKKGKLNFPIYPDRTKLENFITQKGNQASIVAVSDRLLNTIQPYKGGQGEALYQLHQLDIADKHRLLTPQVQVNEITGLVVENEKGERFSTKTKTFLSQPITFRPPGSQNLKLVHSGYSTATIVFDKDTPIPGQVVVPALRHFEAMVNGVLKILE